VTAPDQQFVHLKPAGRICLGEKLGEFQQMTATSLDAAPTRIVLDMAEVTYIDSSGIGEILKLFLEARNRAKKLVLANLPSSILKIMKNAKLDAVFTIAENLDEALKK
jgi:anti-sigma B factor antagonist